jgi:hypothetical protein
MVIEAYEREESRASDLTLLCLILSTECACKSIIKTYTNVCIIFAPWSQSMKNKLDPTTTIHVRCENSSVRSEMKCYFSQKVVKKTEEASAVVSGHCNFWTTKQSNNICFLDENPTDNCQELPPLFQATTILATGFSQDVNIVAKVHFDHPPFTHVKKA